jgi:DNA-binding LacI/PurR family transcriptional regulator
MRKISVESEIYAALRKRIYDGVYAPVSQLPNQRNLACEFSTSPTTISKALGQLRSLGLIEMIQGRGTRVLPLNERSTTGAVAVVKSGGGVFAHQEPARIYQGITETLTANNQHFKFIQGDAFDRYLKHPDSFTNDFAGAVFIEQTGLDLISILDDKQFPYVIANLEENLELTSTFVDHGKTTETAVRFLAAMGHENIAIVTNPTSRLFYAEALEGFKRGLKISGLEFKDKSVIVSESGQELGAYQATRKYFDKLSESIPTAFVACRDYLAYGACSAIKEKRFEIGRDISVIGFDNITWPEADSFLTTFQEPAKEMGCVAAQMLLERLLTGCTIIERREVPSPLIIRSSAGPPPQPIERNHVTPSLHLWSQCST